MNYLATAAQLPDSVGGKVSYGLQTTLIGMLIVFSVLVLIMLVIYLFQLIFYNIPKWAARKKSAVPQADEAVPSAPADTQSEEELVAVLSAAVASYLGGETASSRYRIRSFRRIL